MYKINIDIQERIPTPLIPVILSKAVIINITADIPAPNFKRLKQNFFLQTELYCPSESSPSSKSKSSSSKSILSSSSKFSKAEISI